MSCSKGSWSSTKETGCEVGSSSTSSSSSMLNKTRQKWDEFSSTAYYSKWDRTHIPNIDSTKELFDSLIDPIIGCHPIATFTSFFLLLIKTIRQYIRLHSRQSLNTSSCFNMMMARTRALEENTSEKCTTFPKYKYLTSEFRIFVQEHPQCTYQAELCVICTGHLWSNTRVSKKWTPSMLKQTSIVERD